MLKKLILAGMLVTTLFTTSIHAEEVTCRDLVDSYVLADQEAPTEIGDVLYSEDPEDDMSLYRPVLMETTAYCEGTIGSHGDRMREGYCACGPDMYGSAVMIYEAIPEEDGSYSMGDYIDTFEIRDTGYGYPTGEGRSELRPDKSSAGTIETGVHLDIYKYSYSECKSWMKLTQGKCFAIIVNVEG